MANEWLEKWWTDDHPSPKKEVTCRHCHARNRVLVSRAVIEPEKFICAQCKNALFLTPDEALTGMASRSFEHPQDSSALRTLRAIPGVSALIKLLFKHLSERALLYNLTANAIQCNETQFPELEKIVNLAKDRLGCELKPTVFFTSMPFSNAFTSGGERAILCFSTALLNFLSDEELSFVTGHELGHLMSEHVISRILLVVLLNGGLVALPEIARYLSYPIQYALLKWARCSELTADRAGLLACRNVETALTCLMKMAAGNDIGVTQRTTLSLGAFIEQCLSLRGQDPDLLDSAAGGFFMRNSSHPFIGWRVCELLSWIENGNYLDIMAGDYL